MLGAASMPRSSPIVIPLLLLLISCSSEKRGEPLVFTYALSSDAAYLALGYSDGSIHILRTDHAEARRASTKSAPWTWTPLGVISDKTGAAWLLRFSPDSRYLAVGTLDGWLRLFSTSTLKMQSQTRPVRNEKVLAAEFSPDSNSLAAAVNGRTFNWDLRTGELHEWVGYASFHSLWDQLNYNGVHQKSSIVYSNDGQWLAVIDDDSTVGVWSRKKVDSGELAPSSSTKYGRREDTDQALKRLRHFIPSPDATMVSYCWGAMFSPNDKYILTLSRDSIKVWDTTSWTELTTFKRSPGTGHLGYTGVDISSDSRFIAAVADGRAFEWELASGKLLHQSALPSPADKDLQPLAVRFASDGRMMAIAKIGNEIRAWDAGNENLLFRVDPAFPK
jgi:WD40 repeat protein